MSGEGVLPPDMSQDQDTRGQDPWRHLTATELKARTVTFSAEKEVKLVDYIKCLELHGIRPEEILSIQVSTAGQCRLTFVCEQLAQQVCANGFIFKRNHIFPISVVNRNLQLHIHDVPIWVADAAIVAALSPYGDVQGHIRHGRITVREGVHVASGVRFGTFKPSAARPSPATSEPVTEKALSGCTTKAKRPRAGYATLRSILRSTALPNKEISRSVVCRPVQGTTVSPPQNTAGSSTAQQQQEQNPTVSADNTTKNATQRTAGAWNGQSTLSRPHKEVQVAARMKIRLHQLAHQNLRNSHYLTSTNHRPDRSTYNKIRKHSSSCQLTQLVTSHSQCHKAGSPSPAATLTRTQTVFKCIAPNALEAVSHLKDLAGPLPMHPETRRS